MASPPTTTSYVLTVSDANTCEVRDTVVVTVYPEVTINAGEDKSICKGKEIQIGNEAAEGTPQFIYNWSPPEGLSASNVAQPIAKPDTTTLYTITVTDANGCTATDSVLVTVFPLPVVKLTAPKSDICLGESLLLEATPGYTKYEWYHNGNLLPSTTGNQFTASTEGLYTVIATDNNGCKNRDSLRLYVNIPPKVTSDDLVIICEGGQKPINAGVTGGAGPFTYRWSPSTGLSSPNVLTPIARPAQTTLYTLTVTDANGCTGRDSTLVEIAPLPRADAGEDARACDGAIVVIGKPAQGGTPPYRYEWSPVEGIVSAPDASVQVLVSANTTYRVTVTDANGCTAEDSVRVTLLPAPKATITANGPTSFCEGDSITLDAGAGYATYQWSLNGTLLPSAISHQLTAVTDGLYKVIVTDTNGCVGRDSIRITVRASFEPQLTASATSICAGDSVLLSTSPGYRTYEWYRNGNLITSALSHQYATKVAGIYTVVVSDTSKCKGQSKEIAITVNALPQVRITGASSMCPNAIATYRSANTNGRRWQWSVTGGTIESGQSTSAIRIRWGGTGTGRITLTETVDSSGCQSTASFDVIIDTELHPTITGPTALCEGDTITLDAGEGYATYQWSLNGTLIPSAIRHELRAVAGGLYEVRVSDSSGCSGSERITITVFPKPSTVLTGPSSLCEGDTAMLIATPGYIQYEWFRNDTLIETEVRGQRLEVVSGLYKVKVTDVNGCTTTATHLLTVNPRPSAVVSGPSSICEGDTAVLTATPGYRQYEWFRNDTLIETETKGQRFEVRSGLYTVKITDANGCTATSESFVLNVLPQPSPSIEGARTACLNSTVSYQVMPVLGGVYNWQATGGMITSGQNTNAITIQWTTLGTGRVVIEVEQSECRATDTLEVAVSTNLIPQITASGPTRFCAGDSVMLDAGTGYTTYQWTLNGTLIPSAVSHQITAVAGGLYEVRVTDNTGCSGSASITITVHPKPSSIVTGPSSICEGDTVVLTATPGYRQYEWFRNDTLIETETKGQRSEVRNGLYKVIVTDANGCTATSPLHPLTHYPLPPKPTITQNGNVLTSSPAFTYQWYRNGAPLPSATNLQITVDTSGIYSVRITDVNGCSSMSDPVVITNIATATIALPTIEAAPGERVVIPIELRSATNLSTVTGFNATLRFNRNLLEPIENTPKGIIDNNDRVIPLSQTTTIDNQQSTISSLVFRATLGNVDRTPLVFDAFDFTGQPVDVTLIPGEFRLIICRDGGDRLFDASGTFNLKQNHPNPFNAQTQIEYEIIEQGRTQLYIMDLLGRRVATLVDADIDPGKYRVSYDASSLATGLYIYVLQTPTQALTKMMMVGK